MAIWNLRNVPNELDKLVREEGARRGETVRGTVVRLLCDKFGIGLSQNRNKLVTVVSKSTEKAKPDERHGPVRQLIMKCHQEAFKQQCPWGPDEAGQLGHLLRKIPGATIQELEVMVKNRFRSEGIAPDSPRVWLANLTRYGAGPLDKFGKTKRALKANPTEYLTSRYSAETMEKIRRANLDDDDEGKTN